MNNSTVSESENVQPGIPKSVLVSVNILIMIFALFGNGLLVVSILRSKKLRKRMSSKLVLNLSLCDITIVFVSITDTLVNLKLGYSPFGEIGCRTINPLSTLAIISGVLTLVMVSIERFVVVVYPFYYRSLKGKTFYAIGCSHLISFACVVPYSYHSTTVDGVCEETWPESSSKIYSWFLFLIQYAIPLPIMIIIYSYSWYTVKQQNDDMIRTSERQRSRANAIAEEDIAKAAYNLSKSKPRTRRQSVFVKALHSLRHSPHYNSQLSIKRHKQTMHLLKTFITVVVVFAICMLPNQITWLSGQEISEVWIEIAYWLTYTNSIMNPIIYGLNPRFRGAYLRQIMFCLELCCNKVRSGRLRSNSKSYMSSNDCLYSQHSPSQFKRHFDFLIKHRTSSQTSYDSDDLLSNRDSRSVYLRRSSSAYSSGRKASQYSYDAPASRRRQCDTRQTYQPFYLQNEQQETVYFAEQADQIKQNKNPHYDNVSECAETSEVEMTEHDDTKTISTQRINVEGVALSNKSMLVDCWFDGQRISLVFQKEHLEVLKYISETDC